MNLRKDFCGQDRRRSLTAGILCASVGRLHQSRSTAGHDGEPELAHSSADLSPDRVVGMTFSEPGRSEHRHTRPDEVQRSESCDEAFDGVQRVGVAEGAKDEPELLASGVRPFEP
jgi:hypothetical protein